MYSVQRAGASQLGAGRRRKAVVQLLLAFLLALLFLIASCEKGEQPEPVDRLAPDGGPGAFSRYDPPIEVTAVRPQNQWQFEDGDTIDNNGWTELYEQELGIKLRYLWFSDQYAQRMNIAMMSGQLPDIIPVDGVQLRQLAAAGQLEDLTGALEQYASDMVKEIYAKDGGAALQTATFNGELLALPFLGSYIDTAPLLWIRTDWLDKLGLPEPASLEDVLEIAAAFVHQDPDGNQVADTHGIAISKELWGDLFSIYGFFNSFNAYPRIWIKDSSGKPAYGSIQPEAKEALAKLRELYQSGILNEEFPIQDIYEAGEAAVNGKLGVAFGTHWLPNYVAAGKRQDPEMEWKAYPLLTMDGALAQPMAYYSIPSYYAVRKGMKHPEVAVKMMNVQLHNWEGKYPISRIGYNNGIDKWSYALVLNTNPTQNLDAYHNVTRALKQNARSLVATRSGEREMYDSIQRYLNNGDLAGWAAHRIFGPGGSQSIYAQYKASDRFMLTAFIGGPTATMVEKDTVLQQYELETFTKIIVGEAPLAEFHRFVANWKMLGGDAITNEVAALMAE